MLTIFGATHTLTQEMMVLLAALAAFLLGIVTIAVDVVRRNHRRAEAESRPIDTSMFQHLQGTELPPEAGETAPQEAPPAEAEIAATQSEPPAEPVAEESTAAAEPPPAPQDFTPWTAALEESSPALTPAAQPILNCDAFGAGFGAKTVLSDISLTVLDQGITTLMGPTGTGKSTLLRALAGSFSQSGLFKSWGAAYFRGAPLSADNRPLLVAQRIQLIQRSALENLTFHLRDRTADLPPEKQRHWASQWLDQAGAGDVIALLDKPFMELDQLSQRIVTILREAAAEPALLLIDEPTTGLSESDAAVLLTILERLAAFTPLLVALQNHKHARRISSQIILLAGGQVQATAPAGIFFDTPPNPAVAQFIATGTCPAPAAIRPPAEPTEPTEPAGPPPLTAAALAAIKDEIRNTLALEMAPEPEAEEAAAEPVAELPPAVETHEVPAEALHSEPAPAAPEIAPEPEAAEHLPEPLATEAAPITEDPAAEPLLPEPEAEHLPEPVAYTPTPAEPVFEPEPETLEAEPLPAEPAAEPLFTPAAYEPEPSAPEFELTAEEREAEPLLAEPAVEHLLAPAPEPAAPEPEIHEAEPEAERLSVPLSFSPGPAQPATIDIDADSSTAPPPAFDDLPPISLGPQMMQTVPLPPRATAAQMSPLDPQRHERIAVTRYPGSNNGAAPGPRGFVWIEDGRLAATPMPGITIGIDQDLTLLKQAGITVLVTLTEQNFPQTILAEHGLRNVHFPIADRKAPSTADTDVLVNQMHELLNNGEVLAVHCLAGLGRTGTILAAYMVKEKGVSAQVALNQIRHFNRQFVQTDDQEDFLMEYEVQQEQTVLRNRATEGKFLN